MSYCSKMTSVLLFCTLCSAIVYAQPMLQQASWSAGDDAFVYREFANRTVELRGLPMVIDQEAEYFRSRPLVYTVTGESPVKGRISGFDGAENLRFEGTYLRNSLFGPARTFHTNGATRDSGILLMNLPDGEWKFFNEDGSLKSIRNYDAYMWWSLQWSIELQNPTWNWFALGEMYFKRPGNFMRAVDGRATFGDRYSPPFSYCIQHGKTTNFYDNGIVSDSGYYFKGLPDGIWFFFHENGSLKEFGAWQMGKRVGTWKTLYPSGMLRELRVYKYGEVVESKTYEDKF